MEWADLIRRVRAGEENAVAELYEVLIGSAIPKLSRSVEAEHILDDFHDIVITVLESIRNGTLREPERLIGFASTITRRRVAGHIRFKIAQRRRLVSGEIEEIPAGSHASPDADWIRNERLATLREALRRLCPRDREIIARFYFREEPVTTICAEMGLSPTQFRLFKSRAIARCSRFARQATSPLTCKVA